ncbi:histidine phosphatase family protein [Shouchella lonarensis]|uniref:2,3-bisphosphoglycerate-dependent phosphoglycerate mutase n=1 Tax=Shouchella lonarensis TaxID=1464122 RepID=A0A1G6I0Z3_9BACI|nr:histidine phosphatase family protein [Shouchella lonarensis]SDC00134.1 2,3-bisphosphoglycerate-dependent phosphoglycerate mutase [Shouchella lonarensis]
MDIYLLRHCQASGQEANAPLTNKGYKQATALQHALRDIHIDSIVASPYRRALDSIAPVAQSKDIAVKEDRRLVERRLSSNPIEDWREKLKATFHDFTLSYPGGESSEQAQIRAMSVLTDIQTEKRDCTLLVTHGNLLTLILHAFNNNYGYDVWREMETPDLYHIKTRHLLHMDDMKKIKLHV